LSSQTLARVLAQLDKVDEELTIYTEREPSPDARAAVAVEPDDGSTPEEAKGLALFHDVCTAKDVLEVLEEDLGRKATDEERVEALVYYNEKDSYIPAGTRPTALDHGDGH
jgi:hypothetical protein